MDPYHRHFEFLGYVLLKHILLSDYIEIQTDYDRLYYCVLEKGKVVDISSFSMILSMLVIKDIGI